MFGERVLVRAYRREPLERVVCGVEGKTVMLCNPDLIEDLQARKVFPMGFPIEDVFQFDAELFADLQQTYKESGQHLAQLWQNARPYQRISN